MKNEKILMYMKMKDVSQRKLATLSGIPPTTISRILNGSVVNVKNSHMQAIAAALGTTIYNLFDLPELTKPLTTALRPEEAGTSVEKLLSKEESLLLYWFQNSKLESRTSILMKARSEYYLTQREINEKLAPNPPKTPANETYGQIELLL